jgi:ABC-type antimicrobial peptide transport system permease subunit
VVIDVNSLIEFLELRGLSEFRANEIFIATDAAKHGQVAEQVLAGFRTERLLDKEEMLTESVVDPLAVAGWRGISFVAVIVTGVAATLGYVTYLAAHARRTRNEAAYMRSLGLSRASYFWMVVIEHSLLAALGIGVGIASGLVVSDIAVESIAHTATGRELIPPFVLQTDWLPTALLLAVMAVAGVVAVLAILRAFATAPIHELVRSRE